MALGSVTRTIFYARAWAWQSDGTKEDGSPNFVKVGGSEFKSTKPSKVEAFKALRNDGYKVAREFVTFEIERSEIRALSIDSFIEHSVAVERTENGRIKPMDTDGQGSDNQ